MPDHGAQEGVRLLQRGDGGANPLRVMGRVDQSRKAKTHARAHQMRPLGKQILPFHCPSSPERDFMLFVSASRIMHHLMHIIAGSFSCVNSVCHPSPENKKQARGNVPFARALGCIRKRRDDSPGGFPPSHRLWEYFRHTLPN